MKLHGKRADAINMSVRNFLTEHQHIMGHSVP